MTSREHSDAGNKSSRGRGPSHAHGKKIHRSSGDAASEDSATTNKQQKQHAWNTRGQNYPKRGGDGPAHHSRKYRDKRISETDDIGRFVGQCSTRSTDEQLASRDECKQKPDLIEKDAPHHTKDSDGKKAKTKSKNQMGKARRGAKWRSKADSINKTPESVLLDFSRVSTSAESSGVFGGENSDDDYVSAVSRCSSGKMSPNTLREDLVNSGSDSSASVSDDSSVSDGSSTRNSGRQQHTGATKETDVLLTLPDAMHSNTTLMNFPSVESFIAVYWDIENCAVPCQKSAVHIVKKIRDTFYGKRTEEQFVVACDTRNLNRTVSKELDEAHVDIVHTDSSNKNAADQKLRSFLNRFQHKYARTESAIVLISGDSDFSDVLYEMRYRYHIYIDLVCNRQARKALQAAAHILLFYDDFISDLPNRDKIDNTEYYMTVSGLPSKADKNIIKKQLASKIKSINGRVTKVSANAAEIVFSNKGAADKAWKILQGENICGSNISLRQCTRSYDLTKDSSENDHSKEAVNIPEGKSVLRDANYSPDKTFTNVRQGTTVKKKEKKRNKAEQGISESSATDKKDSVDNDDPVRPMQVMSKNATLKVSVKHRTDDVDFWKNELTKLLKMTDISVQKAGPNFDGFLFINFSSIGKAQKAQKKIQKVQETNPLAPKFIKLIKDDITFDLRADSIQEDKIMAVAGKTEEIKSVIELKRKRCLQKLEEKLNDLTKQGADKSSEELDVIRRKIDELKEQKNVFLKFNNQALLKLNNLSPTLPNVEQILDDHLKDYSRECSCFSEGMPIYARKEDILRTIRKHHVVLISAEAGSGKSTQIVQYLWRAGFGQKGVIVCTQPRKPRVLSLARHVSNQIGSSLGSVVGYQVGYSSKKSEKTQVLFMTDFTMLQQCAAGEPFNGISCIVVDEVQERGIYTDLLLAFIKRALTKRKDLKVIITCALTDTSVFRSYFDLPLDAVLKISGPMFPVLDVWLEENMGAGQNYLEKAVNTAVDLLKEPPGDILVFLTSSHEIEQASSLIEERLSNSDAKVIVHCLHDALDFTEYQKIYDSVPKGSRKIVFATNCAETTITIPGIRYVIDSGMVKKSEYDAVRNLSVLSIGYVSRNSAEQRRDRAGRTQSGKCFRLYTRSNYENDMALITEAEILRVSLAQAVLLLMSLGVQDPVAFNFIEPPSRDSLMAAVKQLAHLGAVDRVDRSMTDMGKKMARLPLEPRLSRLIFKGTEKNIAYESISVAAVASVSRSFFFSKEENNKESGAKTVPLCPAESDFLNYFMLFKEWISAPKAEKPQWCELNSINEKSMKATLELVTELLEIMRSEFDIKITCKSTKEKNFIEIIHNIIFYCFSENLCVFSGYFKFGYCLPDFPGELQIHPTSSLSYLGQPKSQYIVFDTIVNGSQTYMLNVTPVPEDAVRLASQYGWLPYDLNKLSSSVLRPYQINPVGETILRKFIVGKRDHKRFALEKQLQNLIGSKRCGIEVDLAKGEIIVYLSSCYHHFVEEVIFPIIREAQKQLCNEEHQLDISDLSKLCVILGAGAEIRESVLPGEYREVVLKSKAGIPRTRAVAELRKFGEVSSVKEHPTRAVVTFRHVSSAMTAAKEFKSGNYTIQPQMRSHKMGKDEKFFKVLVSVLRKPCNNNLALISFKSQVDVLKAFDTLSDKSVSYGSSRLLIEMTGNKQQLMIKKLPYSATKEDLGKILKKHSLMGVDIGKITIIKNKVFEYTQVDVAEMKQEIIRLFSEHTSPDKVDIEFTKIKPRSLTCNAWAYFHNALNGQTTVNALNGCQITVKDQKHVLQMNPSLNSHIFCDSKVFSVVKDQIEEALNHFKKGKSKGDQLNISAKTARDNSVVITITSNNLPDMIEVRSSILKVLTGEKICSLSLLFCWGNLRLEKLFSKQGRMFLRNLEGKIPNICITFNSTSEVITIFGGKEPCSAAKTEMISYLDDQRGENYTDINLISDGYPRGLLKELAKKYGYVLESLKEFCKLESIAVNTIQHTLSASGETSAISKLKQVLLEISETLRENVIMQPYDDMETCPLCLTPVDVKFHRLQYCGHACCYECLLFHCVHQDVPLKCPEEDCKKPMVIQDIRWVLQEDKEIAKSLLRKAFEFYVDKNKSTLHQCPTPGCYMVYRPGDKDDCEFSCPSCQNDICTRCHTIFHTGLPCELYKYFQKDDSHSLDVWLEADSTNHKMCPNCRGPIERNGSSNHVACWKCKSHMCWLCELVFPTAKDVYNHQPDCLKLSDRNL